MEIKHCSGCNMLVTMYEEDPKPLRWCNHYRKHVSNVKACDSAYKNKEP